MRGLTYIAAAGTALALASMTACSVHQTETPALSGPSTLALSMSISSSPQAITQNGADASVVTVKVIFTDPTTGSTGPKANIPIRFDMAVNGVLQDYGTLSARNAVTAADGTARVTYTAPPMPLGGSTGSGCNGVPGQCVQVVATTTDSTAATSSGASASGAATIALVPPGVILPPAFTPKAAFTFLPAVITVGQQVTFDASTSCPTDASGNCTTTNGSITSYFWTFGDGTTGSGKTITHSYGAANTYVVSLTVTSDRALTASTSQGVQVGLPNAPTADFSVSPSAAIAGQTIFFSADASNAANGHNIVQYSWNYGDGTTDSGQDVSHAYAQAGTYNVVLTIIDDAAQKATKTVQVAISSGNPIALFTASPAGGHTMNFDGSASTAFNNATIVNYSWAFGDGQFGTGQTPNHPYGVAGSFNVRLTVTDSNGRTGSTSQSVTVQ